MGAVEADRRGLTTGLILAVILACSALAAAAAAAWPGISIEIAELKFRRELRKGDPVKVAAALYCIDKRLCIGQRRLHIIERVRPLLGSKDLTVVRAAIISLCCNLDGLNDPPIADALARAMDRYNRARNVRSGDGEELILDDYNEGRRELLIRQRES